MSATTPTRTPPPLRTATIDMKQFRESGAVSEKEYGKLSERLMEKLQGMRVPTIRKGFELTAYAYDEYVANANNDYDRRYAPMADPEMGVDLNVVALVYRARFGMGYFPDFTREYFDLMQMERISLAGTAVEISDLAYCVVPTEKFRSLLLAGLQIEQEVKQRYKMSPISKEVGPDITVETRFFIPLNVFMSETEQMVVTLEVDLYPAEE